MDLPNSSKACWMWIWYTWRFDKNCETFFSCSDFGSRGLTNKYAAFWLIFCFSLDFLQNLLFPLSSSTQSHLNWFLSFESWTLGDRFLVSSLRVANLPRLLDLKCDNVKDKFSITSLQVRHAAVTGVIVGICTHVW